MEKGSRFLFIVIALGLLMSCKNQQEPRTSPEVPGKTVLPRSAAEDITEAGEPRNPQIQGYSEDVSLQVPLEDDEMLLQMFNVNLDLDKNDEQILAIKRKGEPANPIKVVVVDYDEIRTAYARSWESPTQATNQRAFGIELQDVIGDYNLEIICRGVNAQGETTMDIYRKTISPSGMGLYFSSICSLSSDRPIIIETEKRDQSYHEREKTGLAFSITVERKDPESENDLDIIKETWAWKYQEKRYIQILAEKIAGDKLLEERLKGLFSADASEGDFKSFLNGPWHKTNVVDNIILFDPTYDTLSFFNGTVLEVYSIKEIQPGSGFSIALYIESESISNVKKWITISIRDMDSILLSIFPQQTAQTTDEWQGSYVRLSSDLQESLLQKNHKTVTANELTLYGIYRGTDGDEIAFEPPYFTWIQEDGQARSGGFTILGNVPLLNAYYLDREIPEQISVITFRFIDNGGIRSHDQVFVFEYEEKKELGTLTRTILLTPAKIGINGVLLSSKESRALEQLEFSDS